MKNIVSYAAKIKDEFTCFLPTIRIYQDAVNFLINVCNENYALMKDFPSQKAMTVIERLIHSTSARKAVYPSFDKIFHKMPSYLRRQAINTAVGHAKTYRKNLELWESNGCKGKKPRLGRCGNRMPAFYKGNMFVLCEDGSYQVRLKIFIRNDWIWQTFTLNKSDMDRIAVKRGFSFDKASSPVLKKRGRRFSLAFAFETEGRLPETTEKICSVDIGINHSAVCSVMDRTGTVAGRTFIKFPVEEDRFTKVLAYTRKAYSNGSKGCNKLWRWAENYNGCLAIKTATAIVEFALKNNVDAIVMENLSGMGGKIHGSKKQRLALWRKREIARRVEEMAHRRGIRFSTVCAYSTSLLAYDGSGKVARDKDNHSLCTFKTGKRYNADLNASYNIGARYFIREILKTLSGRKVSEVHAKVPELSVRTRCTLATLYSLTAVLVA